MIAAMSRRDAEEAVARLMAWQRSLVTKAQALARGFTEEMIRSRLETGRWVRVGAGVYRLAGAEVTWEQLALAACLIAGPGAVLSHRSAAVVWQLAGCRPGRIDIAVPAGRSGRNSIARVHRVADLARRDVTVRRGLPVTRPARTLEDAASVLTRSALEDAVDDALCRRLVPLEVLVERAVRGSGSGVRALRQVLGTWGPGPLPGSVGEIRVARWLVQHGAPTPVRQCVVRDARGRFVAKVDLGFPAERVALEVHSMRWHGPPRAAARDDIREARIRAAGWTLHWCVATEPLWDALAAIQCARTAA